jgi:DcuC family C4-dicarboxylate transporter
LVLLLGFSPLFKSPVKMEVITAMIISVAVAMAFEYFHRKDGRAVLESVQVFFDGMAKSFAMVVTMIVAGETYGGGLLKFGAIDTLIHEAQTAGLEVHFMIIVMSLLIAVTAFLMGSGNAAFFSFGAVAGKVAAFLHVDAVTLILPMQLMTSLGRVVSPIAPPIFAIAAIAGVSPIQVVKRTAIPMVVAGIVIIAADFIIFVR